MASGELIFLTVPIGNLSDLTGRAQEALSLGTKFIVEDSRVFLSLLSALNIQAEGKEWVVWHDHSLTTELGKVKAWLRDQQKVYVVSDAGSPVLSDPAYTLFDALKECNFTLDAYGGVTSVIQALELSRLPPIPFHFHGFLARHESDVKKQVQACLSTVGTHIYFLSPHRVLDTMDEIVSVAVDAKFSLARELTKKFQEVLTFTADQWPDIKKDLTVKGEFVLLFYIASPEVKTLNSEKIKDLTRDYLAQPKTKTLAKLLAEINGSDVSELYNLLAKDKN